jgi:formylglycine-generating enzyme required for sulfatase activity
VVSRETFGAMSFALEDVWLQATDPALKERAHALSTIVRRAFVAYHSESTPGFRTPPALAVDDPLNMWTKVEPGEFVMGTKDDLFPHDGPPHSVRLSAFSIQQHEVTNEEYRRFDPSHSFPAGQERHPVNNVSWYEAAAYAAWLGVSLPSEAQWEYAARGTGQEPPAGKKGRPYPWGFEPPTSDRGVFDVNPGVRGTKAVGSRGISGQTPEGLDDMAGNVWEWCRDWFGSYSDQIVQDSLGPVTGAIRVVRGGSYVGDRGRAAYRLSRDPTYRYEFLGFRLVSSRLPP